jgi:hypothetical protein
VTHCTVVGASWPRSALAGEYPGARKPEQAAEKLRLLIEEAGIDSIVDLTTPADGLTPYRDALRLAAEKAGRQVTHYAHPIPDMGVVGQEGYDEIIARIRPKHPPAERFTSTAGRKRTHVDGRRLPSHR